MCKWWNGTQVNNEFIDQNTMLKFHGEIFGISICYGVLKLYKNTCLVKDKLNGRNTPWYNVLYE